MIDLTSKTKEEINALMNEYQGLWADMPKIDELIQEVYLIDLAFKYLKEMDIDKDLKTWSVLLIKRLFRTINIEEDVHVEIDKFIKYHNTLYKKYVDELVMYTDKFDRDSSFLTIYIRNMNMLKDS